MTDRHGHNDNPGRVPGLRVMLGLMAAFIMVTAAMRLDRPVSRDAAGADHAQWPDVRIDVNAADEAELQLLPGIGPRLAERIVDERAARGPFRSADDLTRVRGIGPVTLERLREFVIVEEPEDANGRE